MSQTTSQTDYSALIEPTRVHSRLYYDPDIFQEELEKIWYRTWVYVGHTSEIPNKHDYVTKSIGPMPILMVRDRDGEIRLLKINARIAATSFAPIRRATAARSPAPIIHGPSTPMAT